MVFSRLAIALILVVSLWQRTGLCEDAVQPPVTPNPGTAPAAAKPPLSAEDLKEAEAIQAELVLLRNKLNISKTRGSASKVDNVLEQKAAKKKDDPSAKTAMGKLQIGGLIQVWYTNFQHDARGLFDDPANKIIDSNAAGQNSSFRIRRAELNFTYKPNAYVTARLMIDPAREADSFPLVTDNQALGSSPFKQINYVSQEKDTNSTTGAALGLGNVRAINTLRRGYSTMGTLLQDAYINFHNNPENPGDFEWHHDFQVGQFLVPFGEEGLRSSSQLDFVERSFVGILGYNRDMGAQVHGNWWNDRLQYWVGVFNGTQDYHMSNGQGNNRVDNNDSKDFAFRALLRPIDSESWGHMEVGVSGEFGWHGEGGQNDPIVNPRNNLNRPYNWASRYDAWASYTMAGPLSGLWLRGEYGWFKDANAPSSVVDLSGFGKSSSGFAQSQGIPFSVQGGYGAVGYKFNSCPLGSLPAWIKPLEVALRIQAFQNVLTSILGRTKTDVFYTEVYTAGVNYYIKDHNAKLQLNYNKVMQPDSERYLGLRNFHNVKSDSFVVNFQVAF